MGEDLFIAGLSEKLSFRTVNISKTAFASFNFNPDFFSFYPNVNDSDPPRCQISMKAALIVFRFPSGMEKYVEHCDINLKPSEDLVEFRLKYKQGLVKTNKIQLLECEVLQASYESEELPSKLVIEPKVLGEVLSTFQSPEITWAVSSNGVQFRNFSELEDDGAGLRSEVHVAKDDLLEINVAADVELTFCLSELRNILSFAEQVGCPLTVSFSESGKPMFFIMRNEILTAHVVLSTLGLSTSQSTANSSQSIANKSQPLANRSQSRIEERHSIEDNSILLNGNEDDSLNLTQRTLNHRLEKLRRVLKRTSYDITKLPGYDEILAPDSEEEM